MDQLYPPVLSENPNKTALVLFGSPHANGYTAQLLQEFLQYLTSDYQIVFVDSYQEKIAPCMACGFCEIQEGCSLRDFDVIHHYLCSCDLLVVASPIYNLSFPAPLKAILDRTQRYFSARFSLGKKPPIPKSKRSILLLTSGSDCDEGADIMRRQLEMIYTVIHATLERQILWKNTDHHTPLSPLHEEVRRAAQSFLSDRLPNTVKYDTLDKVN